MAGLRSESELSGSRTISSRPVAYSATHYVVFESSLASRAPLSGKRLCPSRWGMHVGPDSGTASAAARFVGLAWVTSLTSAPTARRPWATSGSAVSADVGELQGRDVHRADLVGPH